MNAITLDRVRQLFGDSPDLLTDDDLKELTDSANADADEGAEWLPYYKLSLSLLMRAFGELNAVALNGILGRTPGVVPGKVYEVHGRSCDLARLSLRPCGAGPDASAEKAAEVERMIDETWGKPMRRQPCTTRSN